MNNTLTSTHTIYFDVSKIDYVAGNLASYGDLDPETDADLIDAEIDLWVDYANEHAEFSGYNFRVAHHPWIATAYLVDTPGGRQLAEQVAECCAFATAECKAFDAAMDRADDDRKYTLENG